MTNLEMWELMSYVVTVFGFPLAIFIFIYEQQRERNNEEEEIYLRLTDAYTEFLKLVIQNADLRLRSTAGSHSLTEEQQERVFSIFDLLISLFERAYLLQYEESMSAQQRRRWLSWEDFMREWCRRNDFRAHLPRLLQGEDADFATHILRLADEESRPGLISVHIPPR